MINKEDTLADTKRLCYINSIIGFENIFAPIAILFYTNHVGFNLLEVGFFFALVSISTLIFEIPSGILSDWLGRREVFAAGRIGYISSMILVLFLDKDLIIYVSILFGISIALSSGNTPAIIYSMLKSCNHEKKAGEIFSKSATFSLWSASILSLLGGLLGHIDITYPLIAETILMSTSLIVFLFFTRKYKSSQTETRNPPSGIKILKDGIINISTNKKLLVFIIFSAITFSFLRASYNLYQPVFEMLDIPVIYFGIAFSVMNLIASFGAKLSRLKSKSLFIPISLSALIISALPLFAHNNYIMVISITTILISQQLLRGFESPFSNTSINENINSDNSRTTILSISQFTKSIFSSITMIVFGLCAESYSLGFTLSVTSIAYILISLAILIYFLRASSPKRISSSV
ncbi:MFS transporter [Salinibius halmophilus]|uniref:MFS transporter n=1 Tax=Salinibius halmophilus TaxID=1853216 RepID=UPI000E675A39|nr:MFS transporter [Salinibius halmophilus]